MISNTIQNTTEGETTETETIVHPTKNPETKETILLLIPDPQVTIADVTTKRVTKRKRLVVKTIGATAQFPEENTTTD
jgi:hypothetical protein